METEKDVVKITTTRGRIITLTISRETKTHLEGRDKYGVSVVIPRLDIDSMYPFVLPAGKRN